MNWSKDAYSGPGNQPAPWLSENWRAAHEAPAAVHDHIAADYARRRALELTSQYEADCGKECSESLPCTVHMTHDEWLEWEGKAYVILKELARG